MHQTHDQPMIIITTGGSGGHIFPAEAVARSLLNQGARVAFLTDRRGQAFQGLKGVPVYRLCAESVTGRSLLGKLWAGIKLYIGTIQAVCYMYRLKPSAVVGGGGYASVPAVMAAHLARVPVILHEQNAVLGRANRILARGTRFIGTSFSPTERVPKSVPQIQVGLPVRSAILAVRHTPYPTRTKTLRLFIFGGSQGARFFSRTLPKALLLLPETLRARIDLVQQVRPEDMDIARRFYEPAGFHRLTLRPFFRDMPKQLAKAHLVIGRGGAGTLFELMTVGRPAIIIPLPVAADDHQTANARRFCALGAGWLVPESDFQPNTFSDRLRRLLTTPDTLREAAAAAAANDSADAADKMARAVLDCVKGSAR